MCAIRIIDSDIMSADGNQSKAHSKSGDHYTDEIANS